MPEDFRCYLVTREGDRVTAGITRRPMSELPAGDVLIRVQFSSVNYKDAMAATGNPGVARKLPHVPGIDAAGVVAESTRADLPIGTEVVVTGRELGVERWGGWAEYLRIPGEWALRRPQALTLEDAMTIGTAGFTPAQRAERSGRLLESRTALRSMTSAAPSCRSHSCLSAFPETATTR